MKSLKLDETGDLIINQGSFVEIEGDEELAQSVRILLQRAKDEFFLDPDGGMDREPLFAKKFNEEEARNSIIETIGQEERIASVEEITFTYVKEQRLLLVDLSLLKADGENLTVEGVEIIA